MKDKLKVGQRVLARPLFTYYEGIIIGVCTFSTYDKTVYKIKFDSWFRLAQWVEASEVSALYE